MSGGSFNYLFAVQDLGDILSRTYDLEGMHSSLEALDCAQDVTEKTEEIIDFLRRVDKEFQEKVEPLRDVWKAMEWWRSMDWDEEKFKEALAQYRAHKDV